MRLFAEFSKIDEEQRMVFGYASTGALDSQGEVILPSAVEKALPDYMRFANIREMHKNSAVGVAREVEVDGKGLYLGAKIVDEGAWQKVKEGVYKGFSIGGNVKARDPKDRTIITDIALHEISIVDRPANPEAVFEMYKAADAVAEEAAPALELPAMTVDEAADELAKLCDTGEVTVQGIVAITTAHLAALAAAKELPAKATVQVSAGTVSEAADNPAAPPSLAGSATPGAESAASDTTATDDAVRKVIVAPLTNEMPGMTKAVEPPAAPEPIQVLEEQIDAAKNLDTIAWLSSLIGSLSAMRDSVKSETEAEGDGSNLPAQLTALLTQASSTLRDMVVEETAEEVAGTQVASAESEWAAPGGAIGDKAATPDATAKATDSAAAVAPYTLEFADGSVWRSAPDCTADEAKAFAKATANVDISVAEVFLTNAGWTKTAAKVSRAQLIHDHSVEMGAQCGSAEKAVSGDLQKLADDLADELLKREDELAKTTQQRDALLVRVAELEALPRPGKGVLRVVEKADELTLNQLSDGVPADPTVKDDPLGTFTNIFRKGGRPL